MSASLAIAQLVQAVELLPVLCKEMVATVLLNCAMIWESVQAHVVVY